MFTTLAERDLIQLIWSDKSILHFSLVFFFIDHQQILNNGMTVVTSQYLQFKLEASKAQANFDEIHRKPEEPPVGPVK